MAIADGRESALMFSRLTGWPPPLLLVTVTMQIGIRSRPTLAIRRSSLAGSRFPLNGWRARGSSLRR